MPIDILPKPSLDRARTAPIAGVCLLTGKTGSELGVTGSSPVPPAIHVLNCAKVVL